MSQSFDGLPPFSELQHFTYNSCICVITFPIYHVSVTVDKVIHGCMLSYISRENWILFLLLLCSHIMCANNRIHYARWSYSFVCILRYLIIIIIMKTYLKVLNLWNACKVHSVQCVSMIRSVFSVIFHATYMTVCIQLTHLSYDDCENLCTYFIIVIKSEEWPICHCVGLGHEKMVCPVCLFIFFFCIITTWICDGQIFKG